MDVDRGHTKLRRASSKVCSSWLRIEGTFSRKAYLYTDVLLGQFGSNFKASAGFRQFLIIHQKELLWMDKSALHRLVGVLGLAPSQLA